MAEFADLCFKRQSIRRFSRQQVNSESIDEITETVLTAPSAGNLQAYEVVVIDEFEKKGSLAKAAFGQGYISQAPVVLVFVALPEVSSARYGSRGSQLYAVQDATIACTCAMLAAESLGLATVWIGAFDDAAVARDAGCAENQRPVAILPVGYGDENPRRTGRKTVSAMVRRF